MGRKPLHSLAVGITFVLIISLMLLPACIEETHLPYPYFPVQKEIPEAFLLALLPGKLVLDEEYLRVNDSLILWPYGYTLEIQEDDIWVADEEGRRVARVGDWIEIGGGFIPEEYVEEKIGDTLPESCTGPFFLGNPLIDKEF